MRDMLMRLWLTVAMEFTLHRRLAAGSFEIGRLRGCRLLLKNHASFPWFLLVPEVDNSIEDLHQLDSKTYESVMQAIREVSEFVSQQFKPEKLNVACIGNQVRQMHIHVVARFADDPAWPGTVWAYEGKNPYADEDAAALVAAAKSYFL